MTELVCGRCGKIIRDGEKFTRSRNRGAARSDLGIPFHEDLSICYESPKLEMPGRKDDDTKARTDLLPSKALLAVSLVLKHGADKYSVDNWRRVPNGRARYTAAALRHLLAWMGGEDQDPDSGLPHLDHALCCLLFLSEFNQEGKL